jgi:hypothetical protein
MKYYNIEKFLRILERRFDNQETPMDGEWYVVLNANEPHDDLYGSGPMNTAIAQARYSDNVDDAGYRIVEWFNSQDKPLSGYDFRDWGNHNVYTHQVTVTHWFDDYNIGGLLYELMRNEQ